CSFRFSASKKARRLRGFSGTIVGKSRSMPVQKNFFQPLCRMPCGGPLLPCLLSRKDGTSVTVVFTLSRYACPGGGSPCVPSCPLLALLL
ncbi:MAG: hypothetical protein MSH27_06355, partial [Desulfovibrio piger]|uniref:hypothetical protein n=1 Tax=Desulfovibrio piger TaxID=901 RepID=UPI0026F156DB